MQSVDGVKAKPVHLLQFINENKGDDQEVGRLLTKLLQYPPSRRFLANTKHLTNHYAQFKPVDHEIYTMASLILERRFEDFLNPCRVMLYGPTCKNLFGCDPSTSSKEMAMKAYLFARATKFMISSLGNCSFRACYSSLVLARSLPKNARVFVVSAPSKDQFCIQLNVNGKEWLIYDPLTNPEVLFPHKMYQEEVLAKFPDDRKTGLQFKLQVTKELSEEFFSKCPDFLAKINGLYLNTFPSLQEIIQDKQFLEDLGYHKINLDTSKVQRSIELVQTFLQVPQFNKGKNQVP